MTLENLRNKRLQWLLLQVYEGLFSSRQGYLDGFEIVDSGGFGALSLVDDSRGMGVGCGGEKLSIWVWVVRFLVCFCETTLFQLRGAISWISMDFMYCCVC